MISIDELLKKEDLCDLDNLLCPAPRHRKRLTVILTDAPEPTDLAHATLTLYRYFKVCGEKAKLATIDIAKGTGLTEAEVDTAGQELIKKGYWHTEYDFSIAYYTFTDYPNIKA